MNTFKAGTASRPQTSVELSVSCKCLVNKDVLSLSDPMCVLFTKDTHQSPWQEFGRTETIDNNLNPEFAKKFVVNYYFEERQFLKFELYDIDSASRNLKDHDFLGSLECSLGEIVASVKLTKPLEFQPDGHRAGTITVFAEEVQASKEEVTLQLRGKNLDKKGWFFWTSDPVLAIYRSNIDGGYTLIHRTEVVHQNLNPVWKPFTLPINSFCAGGDKDRQILFKCFDWNNGYEKLIGEFTTTLNGLRQSATEQSFELKTDSTKSGQNCGCIQLLQCIVRQSSTFLDYIHSGTQLNCTIAIDFTASNGDPTKPGSLHFISPYQPSLYARALKAVGEIIQDYDSDKLFPVLGFGARLPPNGVVSHEFFVNGHAQNPYCEGIPGVLAAYETCLRSVQLYGPTCFAPIINHVAGIASATRNGSEYFILLILTDGVIMDMPQTKEAVVNASTLPLSIIIVGIGNEDFSAMEELDGDDVRLSSRGRFASRDIVQFVAFRDFLESAGNTPLEMERSQMRLAREVLAEIPDQFLSYMKVNKIIPGGWKPDAPPPPYVPR